MNITSSTLPDWTLLELDGPVDHPGAAALAPHLDALKYGARVAVSFRGVEYITSSGFRVLIRAARESHTAGGRLVLGNMSAALFKYFNIAGLERLFEFVADVTDVTARTE